MFEKILQKLKEQRGKTSNVSDRSLEDLAHSLENIVETDEQLEKADFTKSIESLDGNIGHIAAEAVKKVQEKKPGNIKKEKVELEKSEQPVNSSEDVPAWAKSLMESNEQLMNRITGMEKEKVTTTRKSQLSKTLEGYPNWYKAPILQSFEKTSFETEEAFDQYMEQIKTNNDEFVTAQQEAGIKVTLPIAQVKQPKDTGQTTELQNARELVKKAKDNKN